MYRNSSDPYVEFLVGEHEKSVSKTKVVKNTLTPKWNSKHRFPIHSPFAEITAKVYDEDVASGDDVLGMVTITDLAHVVEPLVLQVTFPLALLVEHASTAKDVWVYLQEAPGQTDNPNKSPCTLPEGATVCDQSGWYLYRAAITGGPRRVL